MAEIRISSDVDDRAVRQMLDRAVTAISPPKITEALREGAETYRGHARAKVPVKTGALSESIQVYEDGPYAMRVAPDKIYDAVQEFGAVIRPVRAKALRFEVNGMVVYAPKVTIPAQPYMRPTFDEDTADAIDAIEGAIVRSIEG